MSDAPKLLPCPFCGGEAEADHRQPFWHHATGKTGYQTAIHCHDCTVNLTLCHDDHPAVKALVTEAEARGAKNALRDFDKADWFWRTMDPDDNGDTPYEAVHRAMLGNFCVCEVASSFAGPTRYGFTAPVLDPESDDEEFVHFATHEEAMKAAKERSAAAHRKDEETPK